ncbi:MAG: YciI family protein [Acidobacteriota bacterium]
MSDGVLNIHLDLMEKTMAKYMLLLYQSPVSDRPVSPEEMQKALEKYMAWAKKPFTSDSQRLANDGGRVIRPGAGGPRTTDGPYSETKELLGGYYVIEAANYDEAVARTLDHPHLEYGGTIEVRHVFGS